MKTQIEIIVAHFNGSMFIGDQLDSIQKSEVPDECEIFLIVVDDASRPDEFEKLETITAQWANVRLIRNAQNLGVVETFEKGLAHSQAPYVMLCDQDDVWLPHKIAITFQKMRAIEGQGPALVFTNLKTVDRDLNTISERMIDRPCFDPNAEKHQLLFQNFITGCTIMLNRKLIELALPFPFTIPMHDHWLAVCAAFAGRLGYVDQPTMLYRQHSANLVGQPRRHLIDRLSRPLRTVAQFNKGLRLKSIQARELSARLPSVPDQTLTLNVAEAFARRSWRDLRFLIRTNVFTGGGFSLPLLCALYLFTRRSEYAPK